MVLKRKKTVLLIILALTLVLLAVVWLMQAKKQTPLASESATTSLQNMTVPGGNDNATGVVLDDCSMNIPLNLIDDTSLNPDRTVSVYWTDNALQENIKRTFPFNPKTDFNGCSESVKTKLREVDIMARETYGGEYEEMFLR